jgi:hypothetical protein
MIKYERMYYENKITYKEYFELHLKTLTIKEIANYINQNETTAKTLKKKICKAFSKKPNEKITLGELLEYQGILIKLPFDTQNNNNLAS